MKLHVTGGTNLQDLVLFWPELLPADFDHLPGEEADTTIERLRDAGQLIWLPTTKSGLRQRCGDQGCDLHAGCANDLRQQDARKLRPAL